MARTIIGPINANPASQASPVVAIDQANGMRVQFDVYTQPLIDRFGYPHVVVYNSAAGSHNVIVRAGYLPWAQGMSAGDLTIAVSATSVLDLDGQIVLSRHARDAYNSFDVDFDAGTTGSILVVFGNASLVPANTAQNVIVKHLPGYLLAAVVTTLGTAALSHYDHQGALSGSAIHTIAGSAPVGSFYQPALKTQNGITAVSVASGPGATVFFT